MLRGAVAAGVFLGVGGGPVCSSMFRAVRPPVRSKLFPAGLPDVRESMQKKVEEGNGHAAFSAGMAALCHQCGVPQWWENPAMSFLWVQPCWVEVMRADKGSFFTVDYCVFSTPWRKRTRIYTDTSLRGLKLECRGGHSHVHLKGYSAKHRRAWTKVAEPYPRGLRCVSDTKSRWRTICRKFRPSPPCTPFRQTFGPLLHFSLVTLAAALPAKQRTLSSVLRRHPVLLGRLACLESWCTSLRSPLLLLG